MLLTQLFSLSRAAAGGSRGRRCGVLAAGEGCEAGSELIEAARCLALICPLLRPLAFGSLARPSSPSSVQAGLPRLGPGGRKSNEREREKKKNQPPTILRKRGHQGCDFSGKQEFYGLFLSPHIQLEVNSFLSVRGYFLHSLVRSNTTSWGPAMCHVSVRCKPSAPSRSLPTETRGHVPTARCQVRSSMLSAV